MKKKTDKDTRFYLDLDLKNRTIITWGHENRHTMEQSLSNPEHHRVFLTLGQYNKLERHLRELKKGFQ